MSLENHVPSLDLCKKWKQIGGRQDTEFGWQHTINGIYVLNSGFHDYAAPLASELMEWTQEEIAFVFYLSHLEEWRIEHRKGITSDKSLPNALMMMAIELKS